MRRACSRELTNGMGNDKKKKFTDGGRRKEGVGLGGRWRRDEAERRSKLKPKSTSKKTALAQDPPWRKTEGYPCRIGG